MSAIRLWSCEHVPILAQSFWKMRYHSLGTNQYYVGFEDKNVLAIGKMTTTLYKTQFSNGNKLCSSHLDIHYHNKIIKEDCSFHDMDDKRMIFLKYKLKYTDGIYKHSIDFSTDLNYSTNIVPKHFWTLLSGSLQNELVSIRDILKNQSDKIIIL